MKDSYSLNGEYFYEGNVYDAISDLIWEDSSGIFTVFIADSHHSTVDELLRSDAISRLGECMQEAADDIAGEHAEEWYPFEDTSETNLVSDIREVIKRHYTPPNWFSVKDAVELRFHQSPLTGRVIRIPDKADKCLAIEDCYL